MVIRSVVKIEQSIVILEEILSFPYNSELIELEDGTEDYDRWYDAQDWSDYFAQFISNGVYANPSNGLKVESLDNTMVLTIRMGSAFIGGRFYLQKKDFVFAIAPAHLTLGRRDVVICRHDAINRIMQVLYIQGEASAVPQIPPLIRDDDVYDLRLCVITVNPNAQIITQGNILDTRPDNTVCGFVHGLIEQADTTDLFNQYKAFLDEQIEFWQKYQDDRIIDFDLQFINVLNLIGALETQSFVLINNNFDDWSVKRGCEFNITFPEGNVIETITIVSTSMLLAQRDTIFSGNVITTTISFFYPWEHTEGLNKIITTIFAIKKTTTFNPDGSITEEVI